MLAKDILNARSRYDLNKDKRNKTNKLLDFILNRAFWSISYQEESIKFIRIRKPWIGVLCNIPMEEYDEHLFKTVLIKKGYSLEKLQQDKTLLTYIGAVPLKDAPNGEVLNLYKQQKDSEHPEGWYWVYYPLNFPTVRKALLENKI